MENRNERGGVGSDLEGVEEFVIIELLEELVAFAQV